MTDLTKRLSSRKDRPRQRILCSDHPQPEANITHGCGQHPARTADKSKYALKDVHKHLVNYQRYRFTMTITSEAYFCLFQYQNSSLWECLATGRREIPVQGGKRLPDTHLRLYTSFRAAVHLEKRVSDEKSTPRPSEEGVAACPMRFDANCRHAERT